MTEVELLAVVWATQKAHLYLAGSDFELLVDHRPLIPLLNSKTLDEMPSPRLTRQKEKLALYRFTAVWRPGVEHKVVDCFPGHPVDDPSPDDSQEDDEAAAYVRARLLGAHTDGATGDHILPLLDPHLTRLRTEANSDDKYKRLRTTVQQGFPTNKQQLDAATAPFYGLRQDLWVTDDLVLYGSRVVIPASLRREVLHGLHASHQGQDRTLRRPRQVVYWQGITSDIQNMICSCPTCAERLPSHAPEPLLSDHLPSRPFEKTAADLFHYSGCTFLVYTDRFSGWAAVGTTGRTATSSDVIYLLKEWMTEKASQPSS